MLLTPILIIIALFIAGAGHGNPSLAGLIFPQTFLAAQFLPDYSFGIIYVMAIATYPIYGLIIDKFKSKKALFCLISIHISTWLAVFLIME